MTHTHTHTHTDTQTDSDRQTNEQTQTDRETNEQTNEQTDRQTNKQTDIPGLLQFLSTGSKLLVEAHLEGGVVGVDLGQAGAQGARGLRLLLQAGVKAVVVALQRREGHLEVLPLLQQEMNPEGCNIYVTLSMKLKLQHGIEPKGVCYSVHGAEIATWN